MHWRQNTQGCHLQQPEINHSFWWTCSNGDVGMGMPKKSPHIESQREGPQWTTMWHQPSRATAAYSWTKTRLFFRSLSGVLLRWHGIFFFLLLFPHFMSQNAETNSTKRAQKLLDKFIEEGSVNSCKTVVWVQPAVQKPLKSWFSEAGVVYQQMINLNLPDSYALS